jgi:3-keto-5-aminohexanoate cleavage enzyme
MAAQPVVITAAITGSVTGRENSPALPMNSDAIVDSALASWRAGAAIIHLHAREQDGTPTQDVRVFADMVDRIRAQGCDAILNLTTSSAGGRVNDFDERAQVLTLEPEMATLDCGSMNFGDERVFMNPYPFLKRLASDMESLRIIPEIEVFDAGMITTGVRLIDDGLIPAPGVWQVCVGVRGGAPGDLGSISHLVGRLPEGAYWSIMGVGRNQLPANMISLGFGGHVRTGLEDNVLYRPGELATGNEQLVERAVRLAAEFGRPIATPDEAREIVGVAALRGAGV